MKTNELLFYRKRLKVNDIILNSWTEQKNLDNPYRTVAGYIIGVNSVIQFFLTGYMESVK